MSSALRRRRGKAKGEGGAQAKGGVVEEVEKEVKKVEKAVVKEARRAEKAVERKKTRVSPPRPAGRPPMAMVTARHGTGTITRQGRGFSLGEASGIGITPALAAMWGVRIDVRRRSVLDGNVSALRAWHTAGARAKVEHEVEEVEEELEKVGKEVEEEAVAAAEEVVKAVKEVKKGAKRAEKVVKERVGKPRARPKKKAKKT